MDESFRRIDRTKEAKEITVAKNLFEYIYISSIVHNPEII